MFAKATNTISGYGPNIFPFDSRSTWEGIESVVFLLWLVSVNTSLRQALCKEYRAQRNPMLLFVLDGSLFKFRANAPDFVSLFQLPPRRKARNALDFTPCLFSKTILFERQEDTLTNVKGLSSPPKTSFTSCNLYPSSKHFPNFV